MRKAKKAVRKAAEAREKAKAKKNAHTKSTNDDGWNLNESGIWVPPDQNLETISKACVEAGWPPYEELPFRLFKYAPPDWTRIWATLADGLVYFASPLAFNDPYDSRIFPAQTPEEMEKIIRRGNAKIEKSRKAGHDVSQFGTREERERRQVDIRKNPDQSNKEAANFVLRHGNFGICCLSEQCDSLPMWAHYAKDHKGVCFVFNPYVVGKSAPEVGIGRFPFFLVWRVKYRGKIRKWNLKSGWLRHFFEKSKEWAYEKEWRAFTADDKRMVNPITKIPYPPIEGYSQWRKGVGTYPHNGTLLGVILGCRMNENLKKEIGRIAASRGLAVWQASEKISEYSLGFEPCNDRAQQENLHPDKAE